MQLKMIFAVLLIISGYTKAMEREYESQNLARDLETKLPGSLLFLSAWKAVDLGIPVEDCVQGLYNPDITALIYKIKAFKLCTELTKSEKRFFIDLISNPNLSKEQIQEYFPDMIEKYLGKAKFLNKTQLLNQMLIENSKNNKLATIKLLLAVGANINYADWLGKRALTYASDKGYEAVVKILLKKGANPNVRSMGETPLVCALKKGHNNIVKRLIGSGAQVDNVSFISVIEAGKSDIAQLFITSGANINACDDNGKTVLMIAVEKFNVSIVNALIEAGADIDAQDRNGQAALIIAVISFNELLTEKLINSGANVNIEDNYGNTPLKLALKLPRTYAFKIGGLLYKAGAATE